MRDGNVFRRERDDGGLFGLDSGVAGGGDRRLPPATYNPSGPTRAAARRHPSVGRLPHAPVDNVSRCVQHVHTRARTRTHTAAKLPRGFCTLTLRASRSLCLARPLRLSLALARRFFFRICICDRPPPDWVIFFSFRCRARRRSAPPPSRCRDKPIKGKTQKKKKRKKTVHPPPSHFRRPTKNTRCNAHTCVSERSLNAFYTGRYV